MPKFVRQGDNTLTGNNTFTGTNVLSGATTLSGAVTMSGTKTLSGTTTFSTVPSGTYMLASYVGQTTEAATDRVFFVAPVACTVVAVSQVHSVAAGGTSTLQLVKDTGTDAPGAGTDLLSAAFDLNATANTVQTGTLTGTLTLAVGNRLAIDFANTIQSTAGLVVTVLLKVT